MAKRIANCSGCGCTIEIDDDSVTRVLDEKCPSCFGKSPIGSVSVDGIIAQREKRIRKTKGKWGW